MRTIYLVRDDGQLRQVDWEGYVEAFDAGRYVYVTQLPDNDAPE